MSLSHLLAQYQYGSPGSNGVTINLVNPNSPYNHLQTITWSDYLKTGINLLFGIAGVAAFIYLLWGGLQWIMAGGDKEAIDKSRRKIIGALIGLSIVFSVYAIIFIIKTLFGVNVGQIQLRPIGQ